MNRQPAQPAEATLEERKGAAAPSPGDLPYEPPLVVPIGNLRHLLGKSGARTDATYRRPNNGRP